jgi:hypothetical protein
MPKRKGAAANGAEKRNQRPSEYKNGARDASGARLTVTAGRDVIGFVEQRGRTFVAIDVAGTVIGTFPTAPGAATALTESAAC